MNSLEIITAGLGVAARRITVSTVGLVQQIRRLADEKRKMKLAVSLHSLDDEIRRSLIPIAKKIKVSELLDAVEYYYNKVKLRPTFEYVLFDGINNREKDIELLVRLSKRIPCKVNIIPFHKISILKSSGITGQLRPVSLAETEKFSQRLREAYITVFIRTSAGEDIDAACGQLALKDERKKHGPVISEFHYSKMEDI